MKLTSTYGNRIKLGRTCIILVLILAIVFTSTVSSFALAGVDDLVLFTCLGLVAVAYGVTVNSSISLRDLGYLIYQDIKQAQVDLATWANNFYNDGKLVVDQFLINIFDNFSRNNRLNEVYTSNLLEINTASTSETYAYSLINDNANSSISSSFTDREYQTYYDFLNQVHTVGSFGAPSSAFPGAPDPKAIENIVVMLNGVFYNIQRSLVPSFQYRGSSDVLGDSSIYLNSFTPVVNEVVTITNSVGATVNSSSSMLFRYQGDNSGVVNYSSFALPNIGTLNNDMNYAASLLVSANSSLNQVNTVIKVTNRILANRDVIALSALSNLGLNQPESNNVYVPLVNNPIYNPSYQGDLSAALAVGTVINYPRNLLTQTPNGFVLNNVDSNSISRPNVVAGTGTITDSGLSNNSKWLNIPILGDLLRLLEMIYNFLVSKIQQLIDLLQGFFADVLQAIKGFGDFIIDFFSDFIRVVSGYSLYQDLLSHFLPLPVAQFVWAAIEVTLFVGLICLVLSW